MYRPRYFIAGLVFLACSDAPRPIPTASCATVAWRSAPAADSTVALCAPAGFRAARVRARWVRGRVTDSAYAWLSVALLDSAAAAAEWGTGPLPSFTRPVDTTRLHALRAESVATSREHIAGQDVSVETARVSGGQAGLPPQPALRAVWPRPGHGYVLAQGFAERPADLDTLRLMLRTIAFP
jgi:hypothetical protein